MSPEQAIMWAWLAWVISWFAAALWRKRTVKRVEARAEFAHGLVTAAGLFLLFSSSNPGATPVLATWRFDAPWLQLWSPPEMVGWALAAAAVLGFGLCWWARLHLGPLWSGQVMRKHDHRVVGTGPYAVVRHPIYTGLILAAAATALLKGSVLSLAGAALVIAGLWMKARLEERFLRSELGPGVYDAYAAKVPMLVPTLARRG